MGRSESCGARNCLDKPELGKRCIETVYMFKVTCIEIESLLWNHTYTYTHTHIY